ncbi:Anaphase-promoting complex subunit cdc20 [Dictyocoela muelleri]|nr:Anaphase-promoting complex subunit cdc20 [Dictyocoela muelleri]
MENNNFSFLFSSRSTRDRYTLGIRTNILSSAKMNTVTRSERIEQRYIDRAPYKILDAPGMLDDYYLNLVDWSTENIIYIGLGDSLYSYSIETKSVSEVMTGDGGNVCSVSSNGKLLAVGKENGNVCITDSEKGLFGIRQEEGRVATLAWNGNVLSIGSKSGIITNIDVREKKPIGKFIGHTQEVCGLKWSIDKKYLASGSNDNLIRIWQLGLPSSRIILDGHLSAIKALAWCPWRNGILASGGGTKDKTIRFWDVENKKQEKIINTTSQVCTLNFVPKYKELISSHGYSENNINLWKVSTMKKIFTIGSHDARVLHTAISPDGCTFVSAAADENLKFWKILEPEKKTKRDSICWR